jgi:hypothetical protein
MFAIYIEKIWLDYKHDASGRQPPFSDFFALWSYAKILRTNPANDLYDFAILHARQVDLGMLPSDRNPFPYPPIFFLFLWPLSVLPYAVTYLLWISATLALFVWAVAATCSRLPLCLAGVIVAPASIAAISAGQSGFLAGALTIGGIRLAGSRPIVAGLLIGLLSYKPQLALLMPIALVAGRLWTAFGVACLTVAALALGATRLFGWDIWSDWIAILPAYADMFDHGKVDLRFVPTVIGNLRLLGVPLPIAEIVQTAVAIPVIVLVWRCFRREAGRLAAASLLVGTFLVTPHAFVYDMPMVTAAIALFIEARREAGKVFTIWEILILLLTFIFPGLMLAAGLHIPVSCIPLLLFFGLIVWRQHAGDVRLAAP